MAKLKVFRTPIGFHDAYVAAPSRKAALAAWGSSADLFARGVAEEVTEPALVAEPLATPGVVIRRSRGTVAEQLAALPPDPPARSEVGDAGPETAPSPRTKAGRARPATRIAPPAPTPPPSRAALDEAERALAEERDRQAAALAVLAEREARLAEERRTLEARQARERDRLEEERSEAAARYEDACRRWRKATK